VEQVKDEELGQVLTALREGETVGVVEFSKSVPHQYKQIYPNLVLKDSIICKKRNKHDSNLVVVVPKVMQKDIMYQLHATPISGHLAFARTYNKVYERFYWPTMREDVENYCKECESCGARKNPHVYGRAPLQQCTVSQPMEMMAMDVLGPLPISSEGNKFILVVMDYFSKWPEVYALENQKAEVITKCLIDVFTRHGAPKVLLSDQGRNFESNMVKELCAAFGIDKRRTSPYHPECDGMVERFNRALVDMLAMHVNDHHTDWDYWIPQVVFAYRSSIHSSTGVSPFEIVYGRKPTLPIDIQFGIKEETTGDFYGKLKQHLEVVKTKAYKRVVAAKIAQKKQYDKKVKFTSYKVGNRVWLYNPANKPGLSPKLISKWKGPYIIVQKLSDVSYKISGSKQTGVKVVHYNRLKKCCTPVAQPEKVTIQNDNEDDNQGFIVPNTVEIPTERVELSPTEDSDAVTGVSDSDETYQQSTESDQDSAADIQTEPVQAPAEVRISTRYKTQTKFFQS
jgi:hypothetical protein